MARKMTPEEIEAAAVEALSLSLGGADTSIGAARLRNIEAYNAEAVGEWAPPEVLDRSDFVATDVADTINGMLPQLLQMFVSSDDAVEFEAQGQPGSDLEAKLATAYVNHLFYVRNDGLSILHDWFWDALTQKVGFLKVWVDEDADEAKQAYEGQTLEQLAMLMQDGWELVGQPEQGEQGISFTVRKESRTKCVKLLVVAPDEMRVDVNSRWDDDSAIIGQELYRRRYEWEQDGFDVSDVGGNSAGPMTQEAMARLGEGDDFNTSAAHPSHDLIRGAELYMKLDADGDGIVEWVKVCLIEDKLAYYQDGSACIEQVDGHPYVWICPSPRPHAFFGDCPADYAYPAQKLRTTTIRAINDNLLLSVNQRLYVNTRAGVNIDDVLDSRAGGIIRGTEPMANAIAPIVQPSLGGPAYQFNEYIGSWAENRTGFNRYSAGTDANALNKTARGTELLTAKADMRTNMIARHFAVGVRKLFAKMLKLSIQYQNVPEMVAINGQFVPINPSEFKNQYHVKINVGLGTGSKEAQAARIMGLLQIMQLGAQVGVVRPEHFAEAIKLYAEANEFKNPDRFVDAQPTGVPNPQQFQQLQAQVGQQMQALQQQLQQMGQENQQLKQQLADKSMDYQLKAAELGIKQAQASKDDGPSPIEWEKVAISREDAITRRMALGIDAANAEQQFALDHAIATHDAMMAEAAHEQAEQQTPDQD